MDIERLCSYQHLGTLPSCKIFMITSAADLACVNEDGSLVYPMGPCCAWPQQRNIQEQQAPENEVVLSKTKTKIGIGKMAKGFVETTVKAVRYGTLDKDSRDSRYSQCLNCDKFMKASKRCAECGCFMEAKTWVAAATCPLGKW